MEGQNSIVNCHSDADNTPCISRRTTCCDLGRGLGADSMLKAVLRSHGCWFVLAERRRFFTVTLTVTRSRSKFCGLRLVLPVVGGSLFRVDRDSEDVTVLTLDLGCLLVLDEIELSKFQLAARAAAMASCALRFLSTCSGTGATFFGAFGIVTLALKSELPRARLPQFFFEAACSCWLNRGLADPLIGFSSLHYLHYSPSAHRVRGSRTLILSP